MVVMYVALIISANVLCFRQWTSFLAGASTAGYVYMYSFYYYFFKTKFVSFDSVCICRLFIFAKLSFWKTR